MAKFKVLPKTHLRSGAHFTEMEAFQAKLTAAAFTPTKLTELVTKFTEALADEDKYLKQSVSSEFSAQLADTDTERDKDYMAVKQIVDAWRSISVEPQTTAAKAIGVEVDLYKVDVRDQYDQETGLLTNFLEAVTTTANAAHLETLSLTPVVARLKELNEQMKALMASRSDERSTKVAGALKAARKQVDALYDQLTSLIESFSDTADDATPYETFIAEWNAEVERVKQQTASTSSAKRTKSETVKK